MSINWLLSRHKSEFLIFTFFAAISVVFYTSALMAADDYQANDNLKDASSGDNWPAFGRTYGEQHFSPLTEITTDNVGKLGLAWSYELGNGNPMTGPLAVDGKLYTATGYSIVRAFDAATGKELWTYNPEVHKVAGKRLRMFWGIRGLAWWNGKVYVATIDGHLIAIDAKTGKKVWSQQTLDETELGAISGPPRVFDGKVIIGQGGADHSNIRGYVTTYDAETGKKLWRFHTVPGNPADGFENKAMEMAAKTWHGQWWKFGGGGTVWNAMTYDAEFDHILLGVGNGSPWNHKVRSQGKGDNLFLSSIVALDAKTGQYKWHYQTNPGETWDYNAAMDMQLGEMTIKGNTRKIVVTAPKNGFLYTLDRKTGELLSADQIAEVTWATKIDMKTGRPVENPEARFQNGKSFLMMPSPIGAHSWLPMSFDDKKNRVYIPVNEVAATFSDKGFDLVNWKRQPGNAGQGAIIIDFSKHNDPAKKSGSSSLLAWDVANNKQLWRVQTPNFLNGGVMATAGNLVFQGDSNGKFNAYHADSGKLIWSFDAHSPVLGVPITYKANGKQYITVTTGTGASTAIYGMLYKKRFNYYSMKRQVLTFALDANAKLEATEPEELVAFDDDDETPPKLTEEGAFTFETRCAACHGISAVSSGHAPDLRASGFIADLESLTDLLRKGYLMENGMPKYEDDVTDEQIAGIRDYIRVQAAKLRKSKQK